MSNVEEIINKAAERAATEAVKRSRQKIIPAPEYLDSEQAAALTGFTPKALERMRHRDEGPPFYRIGKSVRYRVEDLRAWMEAGRVE